jgi:hypothetical protein
MKGCVLAGRFRFSNPSKNRAVKPSGEQTSPAITPENDVSES